MEGADARSLRETLDKLKDKLGQRVIVLGVVESGRVQLAAGVTPTPPASEGWGSRKFRCPAGRRQRAGGRPGHGDDRGTDPAASLRPCDGEIVGGHSACEFSLDGLSSAVRRSPTAEAAGPD